MATNPTSGSSLFRFPPHNVSQQPKTSEEIKLKGYQQWGQFAKAFVAVSGSILLFGFPLASKTVRDKLAIWWNEFRTGTRKVTIVTSSNTTASIEAAKTAGQLLTGKTQSPPSDIRTSVNKVEAIKTELTTAAPSTVKSRAGELTPENLAEHMQQIVSGYYAQPFPHRDQVTVEHQGQEVLWKSLSPQEKFDVVYEHSLPHNKPKLMKRDQFSAMRRGFPTSKIDYSAEAIMPMERLRLILDSCTIPGFRMEATTGCVWGSSAAYMPTFIINMIRRSN